MTKPSPCQRAILREMASGGVIVMHVGCAWVCGSQMPMTSVRTATVDAMERNGWIKQREECDLSPTFDITAAGRKAAE